MTAPDLATRLIAQETMADAAEMLWVVLANVSGGDWTKQSLEWQEAAARWRDNYFAALAASADHTSHQAERKTLRAQIEALPRYGIVLSRRSASTELEPDGKYVYIADVLALLAKGETP